MTRTDTLLLLHNIWQQQAALWPARALTDEVTILTEADI